MKIKYLNNICLLVMLVSSFGLFSCNDFLSVTPKDRVSDLTAWENESTADLFLNDIYQGIPDFQGGEPLENFSDNAVNGINQVSLSRTFYAQSTYTPSDAPNFWEEWYSNIRRCNLFISNVQNGSAFSEDWEKGRIAEARFLRAYFYHLLWIWHGGVPIIEEVLNHQIQGDEIFRDRNTSDEVFDFIDKELDEIKDDLPLHADEGRVTKGSVLALKSWVELFYASPLNNPSNNLQRWAKAAGTSKELMDLGVYDLFPEYSNLFLENNNGNEEIIFAKQHIGGTSLANMIVSNSGGSKVNGQDRSFANSNPTQELVDDYLMDNGLPISDPTSGYDPNNPYLNREKRFYESIVYDGAEWLGFETVIKTGVGSLNETDLSDLDAVSNTGYYWRKGLDPNYATIANNGNSANSVIYRYAEILLTRKIHL